jgi:hypothetical protein
MMKHKSAREAQQAHRSPARPLKIKRNWTRWYSLIVISLSWPLPRHRQVALNSTNPSRIREVLPRRGSNKRLLMGSSSSKGCNTQLAKVHLESRNVTVWTRCPFCQWLRDLKSRKLTLRKKWESKFTHGSTQSLDWLRVKA